MSSGKQGIIDIRKKKKSKCAITGTPESRTVQVSALVKTFLNGGGKIEKLETGASGLDKEKGSQQIHLSQANKYED